jgi:hypothetical protein
MSATERAVLGALAGLCAVLVKFLGQDYANVVANAANLTADQLLSYKVGYGLLTPILMFLGAFVAWTSDERKRMKIVALAVAAPAMITTWSGGHKPALQADALLPMPSAYAQPAPSNANVRIENPDQVTERGAWQQIQDGVGVFFGYGKQPQKYWVIVGSHKDRSEAQRFADRVNSENKTLNAWVGLRIPPNQYYPVIVGGYSPLSEARELRQRALATKIIKDAYLSADARR